MEKTQMELAFGATRRRPPSLPQRKKARAHWWFEQMRRAVDRALDWTPLPPPRPEQGQLAFGATGK